MPEPNGMFYFVGMEVLPSFVAYGPTRTSEDKRREYPGGFRQQLLNLQTTPPVRLD